LSACGLGSGLPVQAALRKLGQRTVGVVFLLKRLVEQRRRLFHACFYAELLAQAIGVP
jgi:hypothetical protein